MAKDPKTQKKSPDLKYRQVSIDGLDKGRRGKHYDLTRRILQQLKTLSSGAAMEIPLTGGIGLASLRSALHRLSTSHGLQIETQADEKNFYVWRKVKET